MRVHVLSRKKLADAARMHPGLASRLDIWFRIAKKAEWASLDDVRKTYPGADAVGGLTVFNIGGNTYRLIVKIEYKWQKIYIKEVLTHAEYDKADWKI